MIVIFTSESDRARAGCRMMCRSITKETRRNRKFNQKIDETGEKAINLLVQHLEGAKRIAST